MNYWESSYCVKISMIFKKAVKIRKLDIFHFIKCFSNSEVLGELYRHNEAVISQGELYIINLLQEEFPDLLEHKGEYDEETAEWLGYLYGYLMMDGINIGFLRRIDWKRLYGMYDTLHTQSCSYVKTFIKIENVIKDS